MNCVEGGPLPPLAVDKAHRLRSQRRVVRLISRCRKSGQRLVVMSQSGNLFTETQVRLSTLPVAGSFLERPSFIQWPEWRTSERA